MDPRHTQSPALALFDTQPIDCILAAGDTSDIQGLREWIAMLPADTYGQIFIEAADIEEIDHLDAPAGVGVTWVVRDRPHHMPQAAGDCTIRSGQALARAVDAWLDEWLRAESCSPRNFVLWVGAQSNPIMCDFWARIEDEFAAVQA